MTEPTGAKRLNEGKPRIDLVEPLLIIEIAKVMTIGAEKYGDRNWEKGFKWSTVYASLQRHILAWYSGEDTDQESGLSHLSHAACNIMMLIHHNKYKKELDDRVKTVESIKIITNKITNMAILNEPITPFS